MEVPSLSLYSPFIEYDITKEKNQVMNLIIHSADISNPAKPYEVYAQWTTRVLAEFFEQVKNEVFLISRVTKKESLGYLLLTSVTDTLSIQPNLRSVLLTSLLTLCLSS